MKVALIVSPYPLEESPAPPLGLCYAAAAFESAGAEVKIFDYLVRGYTPEKLYSEITEFGPDMVGTNSVTLNYYAAIEILKDVKSRFPEITTVMGGPHVTFDYKNTLKNFPEIDLIVVGEGEETIRELVAIDGNHDKWHDIKGIAYIDNSDVLFTGKREFIQDLDTLPLPSRHLIPLSRYQALGFPVSIITSRGCPNKCIFCQGSRMVGAKVRYRGISRIFDEIEDILSYGFARINIADDFFTSKPDRVAEFCDEVKKRNLNFGWSAFARADSVSQDILRMMMEAGCDCILIGIESGNQDMLNLVKKRVKLERIQKAVSDCKAVGMRVMGTFIIGLPGESTETLADTYRFAEDLKIEFGYHFLAPFPGTPVKDNIEEYDLELLTDDWSQFDANRAIVRTSNLSAEDMERFVYDSFTYFVEKEEAEVIQRCKEGKAGELENLLYLGKQKNEIVHQLFMNDIIEKYAVFNDAGENSPGEKQLTDMITSVLDKAPDIVGHTVRCMIQFGYLKSVTSDKTRTWHWTVNNKTDINPGMEIAVAG